VRDTVFARISLLVSTGHDSNYSTPIGIPFEIAATAIIILSAVVFVKGRALAAILYPTPVSIPIGITASAILILSAIAFVNGRALAAKPSTGGFRHWRLSYWRLSYWRLSYWRLSYWRLSCLRLVAPPEDTVFARIRLLAGWQGAVMARRDPLSAGGSLSYTYATESM